MPEPGDESALGRRQTCRVATPFGDFQAFESDLITQQLQRFGAHQRNELAMVRSRLRAGDHVVDVGAHIGTFAVPLAKRIGPAGRLDAFEAVLQHHALLKLNLKENFPIGRATAHHCLIGTGTGVFAARSKAANSAETWFEPATKASDCSPVSVALDDWWRREASSRQIHLLKVDVEGMEPEVLQSASDLLATWRPLLYLEVHPRHLARKGLRPAEIEEPLKELGYHFFRNLGRRNSRHDHYLLGRLRNLQATGRFFDTLAAHPESDRYPHAVIPRVGSVFVLGLRKWLGYLKFLRRK